MPVHECVQCGFCCRQSPCPFGAWDWERHRCVFLTEDNECSEYENILKQPGADYAPAFGQGCCSPVGNEDRNKLLAEGAD